MKGGIIHQEYGVGSPVLILLVQQLHQLHQEETVGFTVVFALVDGKVEFAGTSGSTYDAQAPHPLRH
jgi:hypothetical protein